LFQFLQPILLLAVAGVAVPVIIHLWNIKQGKTLKIGSILLLTQGSRQSARSIKLTDLLLLFLRCLLLILLAFLMAAPVWKQELSATKEKGWILLEKESLGEAYKKNKPTIDSLLKAGFEFHYFDTVFKNDDLTELLKKQRDTIVSNPLSYWSLLTLLNEKIPASLPVYLFTANSLNRFTGKRPEVALNLQWITYPLSDTTTIWTEKAFLTSFDSVRVIIGNSRPSATFYTYKNLSLNNTLNDDYNLEVRNGKLMVLGSDVGKNGYPKAGVEVDTSAITMTVFTDRFNNDANYVRAALKAIQSFSKRKLQLHLTNNYKDIPVNQDWIFWLSEQTLPAFINAKNVFRYEKGRAENIHSWLIPGDLVTTDGEAISIGKVLQRPASENTLEKIWKDGFGNAVLLREVKGNANVLRFYTRLDPEWNELSWSDEFPKLLLQLILKNDDQSTIALHDKRMIDEKQMRPVLLSGSKTGDNKLTEKTDLTKIFWIIAFVIFFIERLLSFKTKKGIVSV
jgi:hypothetical protein